MVLTKARKVGLIAVTNLVVGFALLTLIELACRHWEQARIERHMPAELRRIPPKGPSEIRVFAFGGSTVFGAPVPEVAFVAQVQYWLHRLYPNRNIRVYNFGYPAVDTAYVLRQLTRRLDDQPDLVIVASGVNDFFGPHHGRIDRLRDVLRLHFATMRLLGQFDYAMMRSWQGYIMPCQVDVWDQESASYKGRIATFNEELNQIAKRVRQKGVPLILCTVPSNLSDWPPIYKRLPGRDRRYIDAVSRIQELLRGGKYQEASDAVTTGFSRYPQDAMLYFLRGQIQAAMGAYADARESFVKARDLDPEPHRVSSGINSLIRRVASGLVGVYLVDLERAYEEHAKNGLVGFDIVADNNHGTPLGESVAAQAIIQKMVEIGFLTPSQKPPEGCCPVDVFLADVGYLEPKSPLRFRALLHNGIFVMKTPFLYYEAAHRYLLEAKEVDENSWQVWANLATLSYFKGDNATGAKELQRAIELHGKPIDLDDRGSTPYLKEALEYAAGHRSDCGAPF
ncbi:MAG: GDSL-type esterase/lipase family protein [Terriglobia bacterium]|jgi:tetratricopeptide (TPR) repeat protein